MKIRDFFKDFNGDNVVIIKDKLTWKTYELRSAQQAILNYGHYTVRDWRIENDIIYISIQSQF